MQRRVGAATFCILVFAMKVCLFHSAAGYLYCLICFRHLFILVTRNCVNVCVCFSGLGAIPTFAGARRGVRSVRSVRGGVVHLPADSEQYVAFARIRRRTLPLRCGYAVHGFFGGTEHALPLLCGCANAWLLKRFRTCWSLRCTDLARAACRLSRGSGTRGTARDNTCVS